MNKNYVIAAIILVAFLFGGYNLVKNSSVRPVNEIETKDKPNEDNEDSPEVSKIMEKEDESKEESDTDETKTFKLEASNFKFSVKEIRVKQGARVSVTLTNKDGFHDFVIDEFNGRTKQLSEGQSETIEFVAEKKGTFEYYCSVGQHRKNGMVGKLIVE